MMYLFITKLDVNFKVRLSLKIIEGITNVIYNLDIWIWVKANDAKG